MEEVEKHSSIDDVAGHRRCVCPASLLTLRMECATSVFFADEKRDARSIGRHETAANPDPSLAYAPTRPNRQGVRRDALHGRPPRRR